MLKTKFINTKNSHKKLNSSNIPIQIAIYKNLKRKYLFSGKTNKYFKQKTTKKLKLFFKLKKKWRF